MTFLLKQAGLFLRAALGSLLLLASACVDLQPMRDEIATLQQSNATLQTQVKDGWHTALCTRDARLLLSAVQKECESGMCDLDIPQQDTIHMHVCNRDPRRRERFLDILTRQDREIFYLYSNSKELSKESQDRLRELVLEAPPLPTTRFLVVSRPWEREPDKRKNAEQRGQLVVKSILGLLSEHFRADPNDAEGRAPISILRKKRTLLWVYEFPLKPGTKTKPIAPNLVAQKPFENWTSPNIDAPADDERAVWVFRVDC